MAATLKLGNANWAAKEGSLLAYNDENDNFKPLPFDFTRASSATYVASDGLIKTSTSGQPRIDFLGNTNGALLIEPQRTNLVTYSESMNQYTPVNGTITPNALTSPDGLTNAVKFFENSNNNLHYFDSNSISVTSGTTYTISVFAKYSGRFLTLQGSSPLGGAFATFNLQNGTVGQQGVGTASIEEMSNDWYRCKLVVQMNTTTANCVVSVLLNDSATGGRSRSYQGDGSSGVFLYGFQFEEGSYPTSYIPTSGSTVTRVAETCSQTPASGVIGQTEGTIYVKYNFDATIDNSGGSDRDIVSISTNSSNTIKIVHYGNGSSSYNKKVYLYSLVGGSYVVTISSPTQSSGLMKVACGYKNNDYVLYVNGVQIGTDTSASVPTSSIVRLGKLSNILTPTPINETKLYNTRLSNSELATLTTI